MHIWYHPHAAKIGTYNIIFFLIIAQCPCLIHILNVFFYREERGFPECVVIALRVISLKIVENVISARLVITMLKLNLNDFQLQN